MRPFGCDGLFFVDSGAICGAAEQVGRLVFLAFFRPVDIMALYLYGHQLNFAYARYKNSLA